MFQTIIKDFQSIDEAKINVDGVTILIGETNSGKSACLRAIEAACLNRFKMGQVKQGKDYATIRIRTSKDAPILTVARNYLGGSPRCQLGTRLFTKLGRALPKEIQQYLNIGEVSINGERYSTTFHPQFSKPMLMEYSQQKVMEILSASVEYDRLKKAKELVLSDRAECKGAIDAVQKITEDTRIQCCCSEAEIAKLEPLVEQISAKIDSVVKLSKTKESIEQLITSVDELSVLKSRIDKLQDLENKLLTAVSYSANTNSVREAIVKVSNYNVVNKYLEVLSSVINKATEACAKSKVQRKLEMLVASMVASTRVAKIEELNVRLSLVLSTDYQQKLYKVEKLASLCSELTATKAQGRLAKKSVKILTEMSKVCEQASQAKQKKTKIADLLDKKSMLDSVETRVKQLVDIVENHKCPICGNIMN